MPDKKHILLCHAPEADGANEKWVSAFVQRLKDRLGREDVSIKTALPQHAVSMPKDALILLLSPFFVHALENDPDYGDFTTMLLRTKLPIYGIEKEFLDENQKTQKLRQIPLFRFWTEKEKEAEKEYFKSLDDLYRQIAKDFPSPKIPEILPEKAKKVFICYAEADIATAKQIYNDLKQRGIEPWMQTEDLLAGQNRRTVIRQAVKSSDYFLVLLSENSISKGDFNRQQKTAFDLMEEMPELDVFVIPARLDNCDPADIRSDFKDIQTADLFPSYENGLQKILKTLGIENSPAQALEKPDIRKSVYLAEVSQDLFAERDDVRRYLEQAGYKVIPETTLYHADVNLYTESVKNALKPCIAFVQLLSLLTCRMHPAQSCYARIQHQCAAQSGIPVLQWRKPGMEMKNADADHRKLLEGPCVFAVHLEEFKREVIHALSKPAKPAPGSATAALPPFVYLNADEKDAALAHRIETLIRSKGMGYAISPLEQDDTEKLDDFRTHLEISDGVMVIYCQADVRWARKQLVECRKFISRQQNPPLIIALYTGPADQKPALNYHLPGMIEMDCRACIQKEEYEPFFTALRQRRAV